MFGKEYGDQLHRHVSLLSVIEGSISPLAGLEGYRHTAPEVRTFGYSFQAKPNPLGRSDGYLECRWSVILLEIEGTLQEISSYLLHSSHRKAGLVMSCSLKKQSDRCLAILGSPMQTVQQVSTHPVLDYRDFHNGTNQRKDRAPAGLSSLGYPFHHQPSTSLRAADYDVISWGGVLHAWCSTM
ncbi:hypothetical protein ASPFODRAFT_49576 [Aspergillus luchuensis CBS 106.47]|uniref:Uncharacterized protein n=1 Tax=Aspergillus luchuensis (strain CBS 106.47) TaxID=1137211 RepID=A0A1M3TBF3_ASPLC|nr:hypothetical protein ASPFODRAFT_49576 [Aspergillus luchuensis CBS 106.47]